MSFATAGIKIACESRREQELARWRAEKEQRRADRRARIAAKKAPEKIAQDTVEFLPLLAEYNAIKAENPGFLLFYRMGDFYELYFGDAEIVAKALGIVLTQRGTHEGRDIPLCGVPVEHDEECLTELIRQGHRVAVCDQVPPEVRARGVEFPHSRVVWRLASPGP